MSEAHHTELMQVVERESQPQKTAFPDLSKPLGNCTMYELELELRRRQEEERKRNACFQNMNLLPMLNSTVFCHKIMPYLKPEECWKLMNKEKLATFRRIFDMEEIYCSAHGHPLKEINNVKADLTSRTKRSLFHASITLPPTPPDDWKALHPCPNSSSCVDCLLASNGYQNCPKFDCRKISKWNEIVTCDNCKHKYCNNGSRECFAICNNSTCRRSGEHRPIAAQCSKCPRFVCNNQLCMTICIACRNPLCRDCEFDRQSHVCSDCVGAWLG